MPRNAPIVRWRQSALYSRNLHAERGKNGRAMNRNRNFSHIFAIWDLKSLHDRPLKNPAEPSNVAAQSD
jgi:hypothetical protein